MVDVLHLPLGAVVSAACRAVSFSFAALRFLAPGGGGEQA
jgi:hypothetical protein